MGQEGTDIQLSSIKGTSMEPTTRPPPTSCVTDLEDSTANLALSSALHRLPVFRNLEAGSSNCTPSGRGTSTKRNGQRRSPSKGHGHSTERVPGTLIFTRGAPSVLRRRAPPTPNTLCGGRCDGVTCMISTATVADAPCLKVDEDKDVGGAIPPDLSGLPILDRLCPFHHVTSMWLVPQHSILCLSCVLHFR